MRMYRLLIMILVIVMACFPASAEGEWQCACNQSNTEKICTGCGMDQETLLGDLNAALALMAEGKYADACFALDLLAGYNCGSLESSAGANVSAQAKWYECNYLWGVHLSETGDYMTATAKFQAAGDYQDAADKVLEMAYAQAEQCMTEGDYEYAMELYMLLYGYKDADQKLIEATYGLGEKYLAEGDFEEALRCFNDTPDFKETALRVKDCELGIAKALLAEGKEDEAFDMFMAIGDHGDCVEQLKSIYYARGLRYAEAGEKENALQALAVVGDYQDAPARLSQLYYELGVAYCDQKDYAKGLQALALAGDHEGARQKLSELHDMLIKEYLAKGEVNMSIALYKQAALGGYEVEDVVALKPGDTGNAAAGVLHLANQMGYIKKLGKDKTTYFDKYEKYIKDMEKKLGLTEDGVLYMSEIYALTEAIYPGSKLAHASDVMMILDDMNYININYNDRTTYKSKYQSGIKRAEKKLGLRADGILTMEEQKAVLQMQPSKPEVVKSLKVKIAKVKKEPEARKVTLGWPKTKGATFYIIYKDGERIALTTGTKYELTMYEGEPGHTFKILAEKYTVAADDFSPEQFVEIEIPENKKK